MVWEKYKFKNIVFRLLYVTKETPLPRRRVW